MNKQTSPDIDPFATFDFPEGKVAFLGMVRIDDFGVHAFRVDLQSRPPLFGEWKSMFEPKGFDFDAEITSFGYLSERNVGNPHPAARLRLSSKEIITVRKLVILLFDQSKNRNKIFPFAVDRANFTEKVSFGDAWALSE